jgi:hypothetical protein
LRAAARSPASTSQADTVRVFAVHASARMQFANKDRSQSNGRSLHAETVWKQILADGSRPARTAT